MKIQYGKRNKDCDTARESAVSGFPPALQTMTFSADSMKGHLLGFAHGDAFLAAYE
jgi:hypothetical protein